MKFKIPKNAKIISINDDYSETIDYDEFSGLYIDTDKGAIKLIISNSQCCCEEFGGLFFETPDSVDKFIGATIVSVEDINVIRDEDFSLDCGDETQLKITTSKGILQYAIYNSHNGYYGHGAIKQVFDKVENLTL